MGVKFNADEIFAMAERIEENGVKFYNKAAEKIGNEEAKRMFKKLASFEETHKAKFAEMRSKLKADQKESTAFDPDNQVHLYLKAAADGHIFDLTDDGSDVLSGDVKAEAVIRRAIGFEKDSIVFYEGLKGMVPKHLGAEAIPEIIREEMAHVTILAGLLSLVK